jgi:hypothetical protein
MASRASWLGPLIALGLFAVAGFERAPPVSADVGVVSVKPQSAARGDRIVAWLACGSCLAPSIARGPRHPPPSFPVSLVDVEQSPEPRNCGERPACGLASTGAPRQPPYTYLGLAEPTFHKRELDEWPCCGSPKYRLRFRVPPVEPGRYALAVYCESCLPGPRGSLIVDPVDPDDGLRVLDERDSAGTGDGFPGIGAWIAGVVGAVVLSVIALGVFRRRRAPQ